MAANDFVCIDDDFSYSRCVFQCNDCVLYEKQLDENKKMDTSTKD